MIQGSTGGTPGDGARHHTALILADFGQVRAIPDHGYAGLLGFYRRHFGDLSLNRTALYVPVVRAVVIW